MVNDSSDIDNEDYAVKMFYVASTANGCWLRKALSANENQHSVMNSGL